MNMTKNLMVVSREFLDEYLEKSYTRVPITHCVMEPPEEHFYKVVATLRGVYRCSSPDEADSIFRETADDGIEYLQEDAFDVIKITEKEYKESTCETAITSKEARTSGLDMLGEVII